MMEETVEGEQVTEEKEVYGANREEKEDSERKTEEMGMVSS